MKRICVVVASQVGLATVACSADLGNRVIVLTVNEIQNDSFMKGIMLIGVDRK
jgi:hypothetical protein